MRMPIRCELCGEMNARTAGKRKEKCRRCGKVLVVPEGLSALPTPQVPPDDPDGNAAHSQATREVLSRAFPWVVSLSLHVALAMVLAMIVVFVIPELPRPSQTQLAVVLPRPDGLGPVAPAPKRPPVDHSGKTAANPHATRPEPPLKLPVPKPPVILSPGPVQPPAQDNPETHPHNDGLFPSRMGPPGPGGNGLEDGPGIVEFPPEPPGYARPQHMLFLIDRSGSMVDSLGRVKVEMLRTIGKLKDDQDFHVIFFGDGPPLENTPRGFVAADRQNMIAVVGFIEPVRAAGKTDPIPALRRAAAVIAGAKPGPGGRNTTLVHLLTDGVFPDNAAVMQAVQVLAARRGLQVNTYLYGQCPPSAQAVMKRIARTLHGEYNPASQGH